MTGSTGPQGPVGPQGPQGPQGEKGDQGLSGLLNITIVSAVSNEVGSQAVKTARADCPSGKQYVTGGGGASEGLGTPFLGPVAISYSGPVLLNNAHLVRAYETTATSSEWFVIAYVICR